jgi:hypothetical protein
MGRFRTVLVAIGLAVLAGCATPSEPPGPDRRLVADAIASAARQVQRCYRTPRIPREGRQITIVLKVRYSGDGMLVGLPELVDQRGVSPTNQFYARQMTEAATLAVIRCSPVSLPPELHAGGWEEIELTFSPRAVA